MMVSARACCRHEQHDEQRTDRARTICSAASGTDPTRRAFRLAVGIASLLALLVVWEILTSFIAYTDDAYVTTGFVAVAPQVTGVIVSVNVAND